MDWQRTTRTADLAEIPREVRKRSVSARRNLHARPHWYCRRIIIAVTDKKHMHAGCA